MTSNDGKASPDRGNLPPVPGRAAGSDRDVPGTLYGVAFWVLLCVLGTLVWPFLLVLPKLSWRWKFTRAAVRLLCACVAIPFETAGVRLSGESCVYVANHVSFLDSFAIGLMFREPVVFVAGGVLSHQRVVGSFLRRIGVVFVKSQEGKGRSSPKSVLSTLEDVVRSGRSIVLFPEGGLTVTAELRRFHLGAFVVAAETGRPVVPVAILGTKEILPAGRRLPRRGAIRLVTGESLLPTGSDWKAAHQLADKARAAIEALLAEA
jgi:1-acyl-sn-glycerol-3-phosphate acyltransferase